MSINLETLRNFIREIIEQELQEASVTGNIDGGEGPPKTPYAFKKKKKKKDEFMSEAKFHIRTDFGSVLIDAGSKGEAKMIVAKKIKGGVKAIISVNRVGVSKAKQVDKKIESVTEGKYHDYRNDDSMSPKQKIGYSMREVRDKLNELDKLVKMNVRFKNEVGVDSTSYWKNTHVAMKKISERLVKLANKVGQLY